MKFIATKKIHPKIIFSLFSVILVLIAACISVDHWPGINSADSAGLVEEFSSDRTPWITGQESIPYELLMYASVKISGDMGLLTLLQLGLHVVFFLLLFWENLFSGSRWSTIIVGLSSILVPMLLVFSQLAERDILFGAILNLAYATFLLAKLKKSESEIRRLKKASLFLFVGAIFIRQECVFAFPFFLFFQYGWERIRAQVKRVIILFFVASLSLLLSEVGHQSMPFFQYHSFNSQSSIEQRLYKSSVGNFFFILSKIPTERWTLSQLELAESLFAEKVAKENWGEVTAASSVLKKNLAELDVAGVNRETVKLIFEYPGIFLGKKAKDLLMALVEIGGLVPRGWIKMEISRKFWIDLTVGWGIQIFEKTKVNSFGLFFLIVPILAIAISGVLSRQIPIATIQISILQFTLVLVFGLLQPVARAKYFYFFFLYLISLLSFLALEIKYLRDRN